MPPSPHSRQSPAVGQRKFGEGRREEKAPGWFHLSEPRMVPLGACEPFFFFFFFLKYIYLFFLDCWLLLKGAWGCVSIPAGRPLACASSWPRSHREGLWPLGCESRSLSEGADVSPWPGACAGSGCWGGLGTPAPALGRLGQCLGPRAAERAQCVPSVSHPGCRAAGSRQRRVAESCCRRGQHPRKQQRKKYY